jgi:hypothetical protein
MKAVQLQSEPKELAGEERPTSLSKDQLAVNEQGLQNGRDHNPVLNVGDTRCGPGGILRRLFLCIGTHCAAQDDLAALYFDRDMLSIRLRVADERLLDALL